MSVVLKMELEGAATVADVVTTGVNKLLLARLVFSRLRFLAKSRISSTFCSPILLLSLPGLKVGKATVAAQAAAKVEAELVCA